MNRRPSPLWSRSKTPKVPPPWSKDRGRRVPAWQPYVHPANRGLVVMIGTDKLAEAVRALGHEVVRAPMRDMGVTTTVDWTTPEGFDAAEMLNILNRCMKVPYPAALSMLRGLQPLPGWADIAAELRTCYRLGTDNDTLRSIIATIATPATGDP